MEFLIEDLVFEDDIKTLISTLKSRNIKYKIYNKNVINSSYTNLDIYKYKTFCYGSLEFIKKIKELNNPNLITSCTIENYDCRIYYPHFAAYSRMKFLFNHNPQIVKAKDIKKYLDSSNFLRPAVGYKPNGFTGGVYELKDLEYIKKCFNKNDEILVCNRKHIDNEYRIIASNNKYVTGCRYKTSCKETNKLGFDPDPVVPENVMDFIYFYLKNIYWYPDEIYIMDFAQSGHETKLLEINALSTSGWYDCDYNKIVDEILLLEN